MTKRRSPVKHTVSSYQKRDGTRVSSHEKGSGTRSRKPSRVVGKAGIDWRKAKSISTLDHKRDIVNESYDALGWGPSEEEIAYNDKGDIVDSIQYELKRRGYKPKRMTESQIRAYTEIEEDEDVLPFDYWVWRKGKKAIVMIHEW